MPGLCAGPVIIFTSGTDDLLSTEWGLGPTTVTLKQIAPWTYGGLTNHIWSYAGKDNRADMNSTFLNVGGHSIFGHHVFDGKNINCNP